MPLLVIACIMSRLWVHGGRSKKHYRNEDLMDRGKRLVIKQELDSIQVEQIIMLIRCVQ